MPFLYDSSSYAAVPVGAVIPIPFTGVPPGFLICDGSSLSQVVYSHLFQQIGTSHGSIGSNFNLPDYRGRFLRGLDAGTARDPDRASRANMSTGGLSGDNIGTVQGHAYQTHTHVQNAHTHIQDAHSHVERGGNNGTNSGSYMARTDGGAATSTLHSTEDATAINQNSTATNQNAQATGAGSQATENETRPLNVTVNYMIRFK